MSRSVKDLRDLICVSRLTIRSTEDEDLCSDEDYLHDQQYERGVDAQKRFSDQLNNMSTPDSGFGTNGLLASDSQNSDSDLPVDSEVYEICSEKTGENFCEKSLSKSDKSYSKKRKPKPGTVKLSLSDQPISKLQSSQLYSRQRASSVLKNELLSVSHHRVDTGAVYDRSITPSADFAEGHFEKLLMYIDGSVISEWLEQSNKNVLELTTWCHAGDNFVQFAHFWLSNFSDKEKFEIFHLEYSILIDQLSFAFAAGLNSGEIQHRHLSMFLSAVFREYPAKLMSSHGAHLFLDYLDILSSSKRLQYQQLLSDVRCSTRVPQHIQWILATRSFAVVSIWSSVVNFYKKLGNYKEDISPCSLSVSTELDHGLHLQRIYVAIRNGYTDVVHYFLKSKKVKPNSRDRQEKSLVFYAVIYRQPKILHLLLHQTSCVIDGNYPASNGNTPLHAAANGGCKELVKELLTSERINVNVCNPQCDNATPLHLAILHGHLEIVQLLLENGADCSMKMGNWAAHDLAREFNQTEIVDLFNDNSK